MTNIDNSQMQGPSSGGGFPGAIGGIQQIISQLVGPNRQVNPYSGAPSGYQMTESRPPHEWFTEDNAMRMYRQLPGAGFFAGMPQPGDAHAIFGNMGQFIHQFGGGLSQKNLATIIRMYVAYKQGEMRGQVQQTEEAFNRMKMEAFQFDQREREMAAAVKAAEAANQTKNGMPTPDFRAELQILAKKYDQPGLVTAFDNRGFKGIDDFITALDARNLDMQKMILAEEKAKTAEPSVEEQPSPQSAEQSQERGPTGQTAAEPPSAQPAPAREPPSPQPPPATATTSPEQGADATQPPPQPQPDRRPAQTQPLIPSPQHAKEGEEQPTPEKGQGAHGMNLFPAIPGNQQETDRSAFANRPGIGPVQEGMARGLLRGDEMGAANAIKNPQEKANVIGAATALRNQVDDAISKYSGIELAKRLYAIDSGFAERAIRLAEFKDPVPGAGFGNRLYAYGGTLESAAMKLNPHWSLQNYNAYQKIVDKDSPDTHTMIFAHSTIPTIRSVLESVNNLEAKYGNKPIPINSIIRNVDNLKGLDPEYWGLANALRTFASEASRTFFPSGSVNVYEDIRNTLSPNATPRELREAIAKESLSLHGRYTSPNDTIKAITGNANAESPYFIPSTADGFLAVGRMDPKSKTTTLPVPPSLHGVIWQVPEGANVYSIPVARGDPNARQVWIYEYKGHRYAVDPSDEEILKRNYGIR